MSDSASDGWGSNLDGPTVLESVKASECGTVEETDAVWDEASVHRWTLRPVWVCEMGHDWERRWERMSLPKEGRKREKR